MFNDLIQRWFSGHFDAPTPVQEAAWREIETGQDVLMAAPTGSGKTLAAFLMAINQLFESPAEETLRVIYVSPLKALSNDIHCNLQQPLSQIQASCESDIQVTAAVWTGDTSPYEREKIKKKPPNILVTTPESLYNIITSKAGRAMVHGVTTVIIDEIHALAPNKRGAHLTLTLMRLEALTLHRPQRIAISATQRPIEKVRDYILHSEHRSVVDLGHKRTLDLSIVTPESPLEIIMSNEQWSEVYDLLAAAIKQHRTTVVFVNNRRLAERAAKHLAERLEDSWVTAHHGSLAKEHRLKSEQDLKAGRLKAIVATASLELGIDIGDVDLVCQVGSPGSIQAFLQRVGRSGHGVGRIPKGMMFPLTIDDLIEACALLQATAQNQLEHIQWPEHPLDVLAQQIVAEVALKPWPVKQLYHLFNTAHSYHSLSEAEFRKVVQMLAEGYSRRATYQKAWITFDAIKDEIRPRKGAQLTAVLNGGTIPDHFDYDVRLLPDDINIGTLNEDFSFESIPGDIFQLGNHSYKILKVTTGTVFVEDAQGQPPNIPFWFGVTMWRSDALSAAVSQVRKQLAQHNQSTRTALQLAQDLKISEANAQQLSDYALNSETVLGVMPSQDDIVVERFFDGNDDMHLVIHSVYGSRLNRAWGLALRKRFCKQFNFELQAAAIEDALILSLSSTHSFPLSDVADYLKPETVKEVLIQALLDTPFFVTQWRWNASIALAVKRRNGGKRVLPQYQRNAAEDLVAEVFPDQIACAENIAGNREVPDHPLVSQTLTDCTQGIMDIDGLSELLGDIQDKKVKMHFVDSQTPSPTSMGIIHARNFAFLDEEDAEARRTLAIQTKDLNHDFTAQRLSAHEVDVFNQSIKPLLRDADELLEYMEYVTLLWPDETEGHEQALKALQASGHATLLTGFDEPVWMATSQREHIYKVWGHLFETTFDGDVLPLLKDMVQGRLAINGIVSLEFLRSRLPVSASVLNQALLMLEAQGVVFRFQESLWVERHHLARLRKSTLGQRRRLIKPIGEKEHQVFLKHWQHRLQPLEGVEGLHQVLLQFEGHAATVSEWENSLLKPRIKDYHPMMLDQLTQSGMWVWKRAGRKSSSVEVTSSSLQKTPITLLQRAHASFMPSDECALPGQTTPVLDALRKGGAMYFDQLRAQTDSLPVSLEQALIFLIKHGLVLVDGIQAARVLSEAPAKRARSLNQAKGRGLSLGYLDMMGRISLAPTEPLDEAVQVHWALSRWGVLSHTIWQKETLPMKWSQANRILSRMEARGEVVAGRFIAAHAGMQYASELAYKKIKSMPTLAA